MLWEDLATIPVFTFPALEAHTVETSGIEFNPSQSGADLEHPGLEHRLTHSCADGEPSAGAASGDGVD